MIAKKKFNIKVILICFFFTKNIYAGAQNDLITILSIDGGGVRGVVPARILQVLEEKTGYPTSKLFDVISGNSTGGLVALGVTVSRDKLVPIYSAKDIVNFYKTHSCDIFKKNLLRTVYTGFNLFGAKYNRDNLDKILFNLFEDTTLSHTLSNVIVTSYSLNKQLPHLWSGRRAKKYREKDFYVRDIAGATSAAPSYFIPKKISNIIETEIYSEVDGGLYANNPSITAGREAIKTFPNLLSNSGKNVIFVSIGTGIVQNKLIVEKKGGLGILGWIKDKNIINIMMDSNSEMVDEIINNIFPYYFRLQIFLPEELIDLDNGDPKNIDKLLRLVDDYLAINKEIIDDLTKKLLYRMKLQKQQHEMLCKKSF